MSKRVSAGQIFLIILFVVAFVAGSVLVYRYFVASGVAPDVDELRDRISDLEAENDVLAEKASDAEGVSTQFFIAFILLSGILYFVFLLSRDSSGNRNVSRSMALLLATRIVYDELGWIEKVKDPSAVYGWVRRYCVTGQAVDGDIDSLWYVVTFALDFPEGGVEPPGHSCVSVGIKSNDPERQVSLEIGVNASEFKRLHGLRLQKNPQPTDLARELAEHANFSQTLGQLLEGDE